MWQPKANANSRTFSVNRTDISKPASITPNISEGPKSGAFQSFGRFVMNSMDRKTTTNTKNTTEAIAKKLEKANSWKDLLKARGAIITNRTALKNILSA